MGEKKDTARVRVLRPKGRGSAGTTQTPGMQREELLSAPGSWVGMVRTEPGHVSGWHHHSDYDTYVYVVSGRLRFESGPGGKDTCEAGPGEVVHVPKHTIHRESNPGSEMQVLFGVRIGTGDPVFNLDGPEQ